MGWWACWKKPAVTASVRIDDESFERLKQLAEEEDRPMTRIVRAAIDAYDQVKLAKVAKRRSPDAAAHAEVADDRAKMAALKAEMPVQTISETVELAKTCPHPKDEHKKHTWGTTCGLCGTIVK